VRKQLDELVCEGYAQKTAVPRSERPPNFRTNPVGMSALSETSEQSEDPSLTCPSPNAGLIRVRSGDSCASIPQIGGTPRGTPVAARGSPQVSPASARASQVSEVAGNGPHVSLASAPPWLKGRLLGQPEPSSEANPPPHLSPSHSPRVTREKVLVSGAHLAARSSAEEPGHSHNQSIDSSDADTAELSRSSGEFASSPARSFGQEFGSPVRSFCRICEAPVPPKELPQHIVLCTANHSCRDKLRKTESSLRTFVSRVRRRSQRVSQLLQAIYIYIYI